MNGTMITLVPLVLLVVVMYFLMIRPQKKRERETTAMRNSLRIGDEIVTIGGLCGKVVKTKDESIVIQVGPDKVKFEMMRWSVSKIVKEGSGHNKNTADDYDEIGEAEEKEAKKAKPKRMKKAVPVADEAEEEAKEVVEKDAEAVEEAAGDVAATEEAASDVEEAAEKTE